MLIIARSNRSDRKIKSWLSELFYYVYDVTSSNVSRQRSQNYLMSLWLYSHVFAYYFSIHSGRKSSLMYLYALPLSSADHCCMQLYLPAFNRNCLAYFTQLYPLVALRLLQLTPLSFLVDFAAIYSNWSKTLGCLFLETTICTYDSSHSYNIPLKKKRLFLLHFAEISSFCCNAFLALQRCFSYYTNLDTLSLIVQGRIMEFRRLELHRWYDRYDFIIRHDSQFLIHDTHICMEWFVVFLLRTR